MDYLWLVFIVTIAAIVHYFAVSRSQGFLTLDGIFVASQLLMATGTLFALDEHSRPDSVYAGVITIPMLIYIGVSVSISIIVRSKTDKKISFVKHRVFVAYRPGRWIIALTLLSAIVTIAYFQAVGYNVLTLGLQDLLAGDASNTDFTTLRLNSYAGSRYLFPGYVNQFKNTILPSLTIVIIYYLFNAKRPHRKLYSVPLILLSFFGILGTGQRGAFILFCLVAITFSYYAHRDRFVRRVVIISVVATPFLMLMTLILGRSSQQLAQTGGVLDSTSVLATEISKRFFSDNQSSGIAGFRYTYGLPTQYGAEWFRGILGILPDNPGSNLAGEIFKSLYGSTRGTAPPSMWGSVYYNFGVGGLILVPILLAAIYQFVTIRAVAHSEMNSLEAIGMSGVFVIFGNWIAGGPEYLLNSGGVTFAILWWLGHHTRAPHPPLAQIIPAAVQSSRRRNRHGVS